MDVKKVALLVAALVVAVISAFMAKSIYSGSAANQANAAPAVPVGPKVLVARRALPVGTIIGADALSFQPWPKELVQGAYYIEGAPDAKIDKLVGTVVRNPITAGQPVTRGALVGPKDRGFLAAALGPGMRAVTVPVTRASGVAGFVFPGDRVDLVLTQTIVGGGDGNPLKVSETIVRNLRVLAADQRLDAKGDDGKMTATYSENVTLEATPRIAEKIAVAQSLGSLSLSLRSIADTTNELERAVAAGEVKLPANATPQQEREMMLQFASRPQDSSTTYVTGGDVSRFQRRTMPQSLESMRTQALKKLESIDRHVSRGYGYGGGYGSNGEVVTGPSVKVSRGNNVTVVPVGAF